VLWPPPPSPNNFHLGRDYDAFDEPGDYAEGGALLHGRRALAARERLAAEVAALERRPRLGREAWPGLPWCLAYAPGGAGRRWCRLAYRRGQPTRTLPRT